MTPKTPKNKLNVTQKEMSVYYFLIFISGTTPFLIILTIPYFLYKVISLRKLKSVVQEAKEELCIDKIVLYKSHFIFMIATQIYFLISVGILSKILALSFSFKVFGLILFFCFAYLFVTRIINGIDAIYKKQAIEKPFSAFHYLSISLPKKEKTNEA